MVDASDVQSLPIDVSGLGGQTAPAPVMPQSPQDFQQAGAAAPPAVSPWKTILQGALWGMANASQPGRGRGSFAQGLGQGAGGAIRGEQQQIENQMAQKQLQFESVQAGDSHIRALNEAQAADDAHQEHQLQLQNFQANIDAANEVFGVKPRLTLSADNGPDMHAQAGGGLKTLAAQNGGTIPEVVTTNDPATASSPTHEIDVYTKPTAQELTQNPSGFRALVDAARKADGQMPTTDQEWNTGGFSVKYGAPATEGLQMRAEQQAGQAKMVMDAYKRLYSPYGGESVAGGDSPEQVSSKNAGTAASLHQRADAYAKSPDANETVAKLLQTQADTFDSAVEDARQKAQAGVNKSTTEGAPAQAAAEGLKTTAEQNAMEPFKEKERQFQAGVTLNTEEAKDANTKNESYWADPQHGYAATMQQVRTANASIDAAKNGNGLLTSFAPTMAVLGINVSAGIHRISPAEAQAAALPGSFVERFNAWFDKASTGKLSPQVTGEAHQLMGILQDSAYNKVLAQSQMAAASGKIPYNAMPAMTPEGRVTTLDKVIMPSGADARVPGPGGKMYWGNSKTHAIIGPAE